MNTNDSCRIKVDPSQLLQYLEQYLEEHKDDPRPEKFSTSSFIVINTDDIDSQIKADEKVLEGFSAEIVAGFLNLGKSDGWPEGIGGAGAMFISYILKKYTRENRDELGIHAPLLEELFQILQETRTSDTESTEGLPKNRRFVYDGNVTGWYEHTVTRMVGNLGSTYNPKNAFFEILINSQGDHQSDLCRPFAITIHANVEVLNQRRQTLASYAKAPQFIAQKFFYSDDLWKSDFFLEKYQDKMGPNSTRMLQGLSFLETVTLKSQTVGNCWMKQAMRSLLVGIYLELLTFQTDKTVQEVWEQALKLYLDIQKRAGIPYIEELLKKCETTPQMYQSAMQAIAYRKTL